MDEFRTTTARRAQLGRPLNEDGPKGRAQSHRAQCRRR
jgi:hypothetical protein